MPIRLHQLALALLACAPLLHAQGTDVTAQFRDSTAPEHKRAALSDIVLWLTPADGTPAPTNNLPHAGYKLVQKNKTFNPHIVVVPTGSSVDFPNQDPFFHNVFSLFNGKRFDLGLYETGSHRSVRFDREGVSYIFCNIHPEMGAIVLALSSPYFALSSADGSVVLHNIAPGRYHLHIWSEQFQPASSADNDKIIQVTAQGLALGPIAVTNAPDALTHHLNKFGEQYPPTPHNPY